MARDAPLPTPAAAQLDALRRENERLHAALDEVEQRLAAQRLASEAAPDGDRVRELDELVRQRTRALAQSEAQLRKKNAELGRMNRIKSEFISIAAHELRTPMTSILGYLDLIQEGRLGPVPDKLQRPVASLYRNAQRLKRLIDDMLDVTRLESGRMVLRRGLHALAPIVQSAVAELEAFAGMKQHSVRVDADPGLTELDIDPDKVHQVVVNLLANAIKYTPEGGRIELLAYPEEAWALLVVRDNGVGIPENLLGELFEPFYDRNTALHHTSAGPDSAGLGLYIAKGIVSLHGGTIQVQSQVGEGTEFRVRLPLASTAPTAAD